MSILKRNTMKANKQTLANWLVLAVYVTAVIFLASRHEPWADEYKVWDMTYRLSFGELIDAMRVEGHFCLWHLCVLPWVRLFGMDYHAIFIASISLMTIATWLLLFKVQFPFIGKLFIIFSAPFIYHFSVIARCYALIPPIVIGIVAVYQRHKSPFLFCFLVGLLAHTHAYMEGLVAILWILFVYHYVIKIWRTDNIRATRNLKAASITVILVILAFLQIAGSVADAGNGIGPAFSKADSDSGWLLYFFSHHRIKAFNSMQLYLCDKIPNLDLSITILAYVAIMYFYSIIIRMQDSNRRCAFLCIIGVSVIWQVLFATNIYGMQFQRVYLTCIPALMVLGMAISKPVSKYCTYIVMLFWLLNTPCQYVIAKDISREYNYDARCAAELEQIIPGEADIFTTGDVSCIRLMKRQLKHMDNPYEVELLNADRPCYMIMSEHMDTTALEGYRIKAIYSGIEGNDEISDIFYENPFTLYLIEYEKDD